MSLAADIGKLRTVHDVNKGALDFAKLALGILKHDGKLADLAAAVDRRGSMEGGLGHDLAGIVRASYRGFSGVEKIGRAEIRKAAVPGQVADAALSSYAAVSNGFIGSLVNAGAFDAMLSSMTPLPARLATVGAISASATAYALSEGDVKRLSKLQLTSQTADPLKVAVMLVLSKELVRAAAPGTAELISAELRRSVSRTTDEVFIGIAASGVSALTSTGSTATAIVEDIRSMFAAIGKGQGARYFLITNATAAVNWTYAADHQGSLAFKDMTPQGGSIQGTSVLVSDAVAANLAYLVDASSFGANGGEMLLSESGEISLHQDDAPNSPPTSSTPYVSLWQTNQTAIRVERFLVIERLRANSVVSISNANNWGGGGSPP